MENKKHQVDKNLNNSVDALTDMLHENRFAARPPIENLPKSPNDPVPNDPFWTPHNCYLFAMNRFCRRWPSAEAIIKEDPKVAVDYAINVLDDAWPKDENGRYAENLISKDPGLALWYAKMVKGRWEKIEPSMASKANYAYEYARNVLEHQWDGQYAEDAVEIISSDPYIATLYCMDLKFPKRYDSPRTERMILDSVYGALYAHAVAPQMTIKELNNEVDSRLEAVHVGQNMDLTDVLEESSYVDRTIWTNPKPDFKTSKPGVLVHYAEDIIKGRWSEAEPYILEKCLKCESRYDRDCLFDYALNVIMPYDRSNPNYDRGRWPEAEPIIALDPHVAYCYARSILNERWLDPLTELTILNSDSAKYYAQYVAKTSEDELREDVERRLKDLHPHDNVDLSSTTDEAIDRLIPLITEGIMPDPKTMTLKELYGYTRDIINKGESLGIRWPEAEPTIMKSPEYAYRYTRTIINKDECLGIRWPKAEPYIMKDPENAYRYTRDIINKDEPLGIRWPKAEPTIMKDPHYACEYARDIINKNENLGIRWPEAEPYIMKNVYSAYWYAKYIINKNRDLGIRWFEAEPDIMENTDLALSYAENIAKMPLEELTAEITTRINSITQDDSIDLSDTFEESIDNLLPLITEEDEALPDFRMMTPESAFEYVLHVKNRGNHHPAIRCPEAEPTIAKDPEFAYYYAVDIINDEKCLGKRWLEAEIVNGGLKDNPKWAFYYVKVVINQGRDHGKRWLDCETAIITDEIKTKIYAKDYAKMPADEFVAEVKSRIKSITQDDNIDLSNTFEESINNLLPLITENEEDQRPDPSGWTADECMQYLMDEGLWGKKKTWSTAEPIIMTDPHCAYYYARDNLKARWPEAEPIIMTDPYIACHYALDVINKRKRRGKIRWEVAENIIRSDPQSAYDYADLIVGERWDPETEFKIIESNIPDLGQDYADNVAGMSLFDLKTELDNLLGALHPGDYVDLSGSIEEVIDRLMPLITEKSRKDFWGRRKEFKENYPISNWLDKAINRLKAKFRGCDSTLFQKAIISLKSKAEEYKKKGAANFSIGHDSFSCSSKLYPPREAIDDITMPRAVKSLVIKAFNDEESRLEKEYEDSMKDKWEHEWPAPKHRQEETIQYDLKRRLREKTRKNKEELKSYKDTTASDDKDLSETDEE